MPGKKLTVPEKHQLAIARKTLKMSDAGAQIMGGMSKREARKVIKRLTGKEAKESFGEQLEELQKRAGICEQEDFEFDLGKIAQELDYIQNLVKTNNGVKAAMRLERLSLQFQRMDDEGWDFGKSSRM